MIIVTYSPFEIESHATICTEDSQALYNVPSSIGKLAEALVTLAHNHDTYNIKIQASGEFISHLAQLIIENESSTYACNKIHVTGV